MRSIALSFVFVLAISYQIAIVNAQSADNNGDLENIAPILKIAENNSSAEIGSINNSISETDSLPTLGLPSLQPANEITSENNQENSANISDSNNTSNADTNTNNTAADSNSDSNTNSDSKSNDVGISQSWDKWNNQFSPRNNNSPVPKGELPPPPAYNNNNNSGNYGYSYGYDYGYDRYGNNKAPANQSISSEQYENKPIPYLMWHRDPWTHRLSLAPYAPGYAAAPNDFQIPPSDFSRWLTKFPSHGVYWKPTQYLGYYDQMPEIVSATPSRSQLILGYPNVPQTQYRDPYTGQPLNYNPAINPEQLLPVRESLLDRWRQRSLARRSAPLGQFPGQPPILPQPTPSPLFGGQPQFYNPNQPNAQENQQEFNQNQYSRQFQQNQFQTQPRYVRRPIGRFRQGLRDRIQKLGIFEALTQSRSGNINPNTPNSNAVYGEAPNYDGTN
ncbi:MAG: MSCRAMM family adhesin SdrC [Planctomycetaceae bacterium]|jgi:hypothetical protein|nr:MSCRAMM family adhesin SdrC [Planctomycetaceae bacterium]